jgi:hypothetical protein
MPKWQKLFLGAAFLALACVPVRGQSNKSSPGIASGLLTNRSFPRCLRR